MQNLKISIYLNGAAKLNRFTTIDSILLAQYYAFMEKKGKRYEFDPEHKSVNFIHRENGVFSGSIWYLQKDSDFFLDFQSKIKTVEHRKIYDTTKGKTSENALFKNGLIFDETIYASPIYFYIKGDKKVIELILKSQLKFIGKDRKLGFGEVSDIIIEEINEDKGFLIDSNTAAKPLPINDFKVNSKKITFFRKSAPYWLNDDFEKCYMPSLYLMETSDTSAATDEFEVSNIDYISNIDFIYKMAKDENCIKDENCKFNDTFSFEKNKPTRAACEWTENNTTLKCAFSNSIKPVGVVNDLKKFLVKWKQSFADYEYLKNQDFLSYESIWCIDNLDPISYACITNDSWFFMQGSNKKAGNTINDYMYKFSTLKPPFTINLKDTANKQHLSFKGKVSVSNAFFFIQYGNQTLMVDTQALNEAKEELKTLLELHPKLTKTYFLGNFLDKFHVQLNKNTYEFEDIILNFQKKYDMNTRKLLSIVAY